jgi:hypothetical protein
MTISISLFRREIRLDSVSPMTVSSLSVGMMIDSFIADVVYLLSLLSVPDSPGFSIVIGGSTARYSSVMLIQRCCDPPSG